MQFTSIKTRRLNPPQDDLFSVLDESLTDVAEGDIILITSKVVGIHQGRCIPKDETDRDALIAAEADHTMSDADHLFPVTIKNHNLTIASGIDASNSGTYYSLLPEQPFEAAREIWEHLRNTHQVSQLGIIITDSQVKPMRVGVIGATISWWGIHPAEHHRGKTDLFGEPLKFSATNIVDSLAAGSAAVCGEAGEGTPIVIVRDAPGVTYTDLDTRHELLKGMKEDVYYPLLKPFYEN